MTAIVGKNSEGWTEKFLRNAMTKTKGARL